MNKYFLILTLAISYLLITCNQPAATSFDKQWAKTFIDSVNTKFSDLFRRGDSAALADYYWPDAEILLDNQEPITGKDILPAWGAMTRMGIKDFTFTTTDITGENNLMVETGQYRMTNQNDSLVDRGKYVVVWQKRDGKWKLFRDTGTTSMPR